MKPLLLTIALLFSTPAWAEWELVVEQETQYLVDFDRIKKINGYIYFWLLKKYPVPREAGALSSKSYMTVDCNLLSYRTLQFSAFKKPIGDDLILTITPENTPGMDETKYALPGSVVEFYLKTVCERV